MKLEEAIDQLRKFKESGKTPLGYFGVGNLTMRVPTEYLELLESIAIESLGQHQSPTDDRYLNAGLFPFFVADDSNSLAEMEQNRKEDDCEERRHGVRTEE